MVVVICNTGVYNCPLAVASPVGCGLLQVSPAWGDTIWGDLILRCETILPLICREYLFFHFGPYPHLDHKLTDFAFFF